MMECHRKIGYTARSLESSAWADIDMRECKPVGRMKEWESHALPGSIVQDIERELAARPRDWNWRMTRVIITSNECRLMTSARWACKCIVFLGTLF